VIDRTLVQERLYQIQRSLERLERLARTPREAFLAPDSDLPAVAESHLRRSLEASFDVGRHILAKTGHVEFVTEYEGIARGMVDTGVVDRSLLEPLVGMAGYRNRLVHLYHQVSDEELYEILRTRLGDLRAFIREIKAYLARREAEESGHERD